MSALKRSTAKGEALVSLPQRLANITAILRREYCRKHKYPWLIAILRREGFHVASAISLGDGF